MKSLGWKKGSRLRLCFWVIDDVPEKKGVDLWKQMSQRKCSFKCICGIFWPLNPSTTTVYARSAFYPSLCFTLSLQSAFYTQSAFYPWSAVCVLHWPIKKCWVCDDRFILEAFGIMLEIQSLEKVKTKNFERRKIKPVSTRIQRSETKRNLQWLFELDYQTFQDISLPSQWSNSHCPTDHFCSCWVEVTLYSLTCTKRYERQWSCNAMRAWSLSMERIC